MSLKAKVVSGIKWTSLGAVLTTGIQFFQNIVMAHLLNPTDFGQMALVALCVGLLFPVFDFGLSAAVIQSKEINRLQLSTLYWINIFLGFCCSLLLFLAAPFIATFFEDEALKWFLQVAAIHFILVGWGTLYAALIAKNLLFDLQNKIAIAAAILAFITAVLLALNGYGVWSLIFAFLVQNVTTSLLNILAGFRLFRPQFSYQFSAVSKLLNFGSFYAANNIINFLSANLDKIVIGKFLGTEALGLYSLVWNLVLMPVRKLNPIITNVAFPVFSKIQDDPKSVSKYYTQMISSLMVITLPLLLILSLLAEDFLFYWYGEKWMAASMTLSILAFVGILKSFANPGGTLFVAKGWANLLFYWNLVWTIALFASLYLVLEYWPSIESIAIMQVGLGLTLGLVWHWMIIKYGRIDYRPILKKVLGLLLFIIPLYLTYLGIENWLTWDSLLTFFVKIFIGLSLYLLYLFLFFKGEILVFKSLFSLTTEKSKNQSLPK